MTSTNLFYIQEYDEDPIVTTTTTDGGEQSSTTTTTATKCCREYEYRVNNNNNVSSSSSSLSSSWKELKLENNNDNISSTTNRNSMTHNNIIYNFYNIIRYYYMLMYHYIIHLIKDLFLPIGYPYTVRVGYIEYQIYDSIQGLCSYLRNVLCTISIMEAIGVGNANASIISTTLSWIYKDGFGMIGSIYFTYISSIYYDGHLKEFRLYADIMNDIGFLCDMILPYFNTNTKFYISSISVLCKTMCGIAAGATKSNVTLHFAIAGNMADLNAKESTQETLVSLIGMILGIFITKILHYNYTNTDNTDNTVNNSYDKLSNWIIFWLLTIIHVYANYCAVKILRLRTINRARMECIIKDMIPILLSFNNNKDENIIDCEYNLNYYIPKPENVNESLIISASYIFFHNHIILKCKSIKYILSQYNNIDVSILLNDIFHNEKYIVTYNHNNNNHNVYICLRIGSTYIDEMKAFIHATLIIEYYNNNIDDDVSKSSSIDIIRNTHYIVQQLFVTATTTSTNSINSNPTTTTKTNSSSSEIVDNNNNNSSSINNNNQPMIIRILQQKGWDTNVLYLGYTRKRYQWTTQPVMNYDTTNTNRTKKKSE